MFFDEIKPNTQDTISISNQSELKVDNEDEMIETNSLDGSNSETEIIFDSFYGLCLECNEPKTDFKWCQQCNAKRFQQDFQNWTSGNEYIDKFIQETQLNTQNNNEILEWIPYDRLTNIRCWDRNKNEWDRNNYHNNGCNVAIKNLYNSSNVNDDFLDEVNKFF